jgi:hypothetical protein
MILLLLLTNCASPFNVNVALFAESAVSQTGGTAMLLATDGEMECDTFVQSIDQGSLASDGDLDENSGVLFSLNYYATGNANEDAWEGVFSAGGATTYGPGDTAAHRSVIASWFEPDALWMVDSSALVLTLEPEDDDVISGSWGHPFGDGSFDAEDCGTYGSGGMR